MSVPAVLRFAVALLALAVLGCQGQEGAPAHPPVRPVQSMVLTAAGAGTQTFTGIVQARTRTSYAFQVLGQLVAREVKVGDVVGAGTLMAAIDPTTLELNVRTAEAALRAAAAARENAETAAARIAALRKSGTAAEASWDAARAARDAAVAKVGQAEADLAKARDMLGYARLVAGFDGVVTATGAEVGQTVSAGQMVVTLARPDLRDGVIDVPDWMAGEMAPGTAFRVSLEIAPSVTAAGTVREVAPQADALTRTRRIKIALDDPPDMFRLGSMVTAAVDGAEKMVLTVPETAILSRNGKDYVWIVRADGGATAEPALGTVTARAVDVGSDGEGMVAISGGVRAGERVVTAGVHSLVEGQRVALSGGLR